MNSSKTISSKMLFGKIVDRLSNIYTIEESRQLTKMLFEEVMSLPYEKIMIDEAIEEGALSNAGLEEKIERLLNFHPIQYVLGKAYFFGREYMVDPNVLIPRQETEELINEIIIDNKKPGLNILDIGSGSGCIGITLTLELNDPKVSALDIDEKALELTRLNAQQHDAKLSCVLQDILTSNKLPENYDIIVSNPPYITEKEKQLMQNNVLDHEPHIALFVPDDDPLVFYTKIVALAKKHLNPGGKLYLEINEHYGHELLTLCEKEKCSYVQLVKDLNGKDRILKVMFG